MRTAYQGLLSQPGGSHCSEHARPLRVCALELCYQHEFAQATKGVKASLLHRCLLDTVVCHGASVYAQKTTLLSFSVSTRHASIMLYVQITQLPAIS